MKVIIPVAGLGSRLKPHTFTTPKPLMKVAGKPILEYVLEEIKTVSPSEVILIVGYHKEQVIDYVKNNFSDLNCKFISQKVMDGDGGAIRVGLESFVNSQNDESLYIIFGADTLIDFNLKKEIENAKGLDALIFSMQVSEPSHYGILNVDNYNNVKSVEEKPKNPKSNLAIIGAYYFRSTKLVKSLLDKYYLNNQTIKGEYKIVQVIQDYIKNQDLSIKTVEVSKWFDCGRPQVLLDANKYFLGKFYSNSKIEQIGDSLIIPPCYISNSVELSHSIIGPYTSISENSKISDSMIKSSIIGENSVVSGMKLDNSLIGKQVYITGRSTSTNIGDKSEINLN